MNPRYYQQAIVNKLNQVFDQGTAVSSWRPFAGEGGRIYQPVVDIAVGPFATEGRFILEYNNLVREHEGLIDRWIQVFQANWDGLEYTRPFAVLPPGPSTHQNFLGRYSNQNARCFIAVEIENETTRKHLMGSIVNAGALGRIGILIAWQDKVLKAAIRMREYFDFLRRVEKRTFDMTGVLVLTPEQFASSLDL